MLERIKILIAMQLRDRHRRRKVHPLVFVLLRVLAVICITAGVWVVFFFFNNIMALRVDRAFLLFLVGLILLISVIGNTNELMKTLYLGKDNPILFALPASISRPCRHIASRPCLPLRRSRSAHGRRVLRQVLFFSPPRRAIPAIPSHLRSPYGFQATGTGGPYLPPFRRRASAADGGSGMAGRLRPPDPLRP